MPTPRRIQVCMENRLAHPDALALLAAKGIKVEVESCLDQCTRCAHCALALVDGRYVSAPTTADLLRQMTSPGRRP